MSTSWQYGDVSPARYPDLESKRKRRGGAASSVNHGGGKKKKESKKKETITVPSSSSSSPTEGTIQQMVPVGLDAFAKDTVVHESPQALATGSFRRPWVHKSDPITQHSTIPVLMDHAI